MSSMLTSLAIVAALCAMSVLSHSTYADELLNLEKNKVARGYDVVSYIEDHTAERGDKEFSVTIDNVIYQFASEDHKTKFLNDPAKYELAYGGWCAYAMADGDKVNIDPKTFTIIDGKTYLFYNGFWGDTLKKWNEENPTELKDRADKAWADIVADHEKNQ